MRAGIISVCSLLYIARGFSINAWGIRNDITGCPPPCKISPGSTTLPKQPTLTIVRALLTICVPRIGRGTLGWMMPGSCPQSLHPSQGRQTIDKKTPDHNKGFPEKKTEAYDKGSLNFSPPLLVSLCFSSIPSLTPAPLAQRISGGSLGASANQISETRTLLNV